MELLNGGVLELWKCVVVESSNEWWNGGVVELSNRPIVECGMVELRDYHYYYC